MTLRTTEHDTPPGNNAAISPRETMRILPGVLQLPLTFLTGKPLAGQRGPHLTPTFHLVAGWGNLLAGLVVGAAGWHLGGWWLLLLLPGWAVTLHGARNLRMLIYHQCSHRNMYGRTAVDRLIAELVSGVLVIQNFERYSREHVADHHAVHHMTLRDPTVQAFLISLDLHPGMTRARMWRRVTAKMLSPRFHLSFLISRVRTFWSKSAAAERAVFVVAYAGLAVISTTLGLWPAVLVLWFLPMIPFYQVSNTLRLCVKHTFPPPGVVTRRGRDYFASLTNAIFIGEPAPAGSRGARGLARWAGWWSRMAFVHFPVRYLVLTGDTVVHDFHHRHPSDKRWPDYIFARQQDIDAGHPGWPPYEAEWGLTAAINRVFDSLSVADPRDYDVNELVTVSRRELFAAFDD